MYNGLALFNVASALAQHAGQRQSLVARNIANADTPGYKARDLPSFADIQREGAGFALRTNRPEHRAGPIGGPGAAESRVVPLPGDASPDGNEVSVETEMVRAAEIRQQHELAVSVYRSGLDLLRTSLGRAR